MHNPLLISLPPLSSLLLWPDVLFPCWRCFRKLCWLEVNTFNDNDLPHPNLMFNHINNGQHIQHLPTTHTPQHSNTSPSSPAPVTVLESMNIWWMRLLILGVFCGRSLRSRLVPNVLHHADRGTVIMRHHASPCVTIRHHASSCVAITTSIMSPCRL